MKDEYVTAFRGVVQHTQNDTGFTLPIHIESYIVLLLANFVEKPDFLPNTSFAESFLNNQSPKELADTCLFVSGVFPDFGSKNGISRRYYQDIGISSYDIVSNTLNTDLFSDLSKHFVFLSNFIELSTKETEIKDLFF